MRTPLCGCQTTGNVASKEERQVTREGLWKRASEQIDWDWEKFRREAAKDILCAITCHGMVGNDAHYKLMAGEAIKQADELIKQLKEDEK